MKKILVSLISDQTIPNILAIDHFKPDELLFLSTQEMEEKNKTEAILKTLAKRRPGYSYDSSTIIVDEYSIRRCHKVIEQWITDKEDSEFIVNLTGGTKIMSIAVYEFFKDYSSKMIYIPITKNEFISPFPKKSSTPSTALKLRVDVMEYLTAYGLKTINEHKLEEYKTVSLERKEISKWIIKNYKEIKILLKWFYKFLGPHRDDKWYDLKEKFHHATQKDNELLLKMGISTHNGFINKKLKRSEIRYLTGGWLEEFCFTEVSELIGNGVDHVVIGNILKNKEGTSNEFDVMFTRNNALYFVECKTLDQPAQKGKSDLYQIGALQKEFGLRIKSFFVSTSEEILKNGQIKNWLKNRAEQFNTKIVHPDEIINFREFLSHQLKLGQ